MTVLRGYQAEGVAKTYDAWGNDIRTVMYRLACGMGKCLGKDTPVLMHDATVKLVQDVRVGDRLMGPDSKPRIVQGLARGREPLYRVTPIKGDPYVVNESHILSLKHLGDYGVVNVPVREYLNKGKTWRTEHKGWRAAVDFPQSITFMPGYIFGAWLGDGSVHKPEITTGDPEIYWEFCAYAETLGCRVSIKPNSPGSFCMSLVRQTGIGRGRRASPFTELLIASGFSGARKVLPHAFKCASRSERLELLAGFIDTDGSLVGGGYDVSQKDEALLDAMIFVARSLGFAAYKKPCRKTCGNNGVAGDYFRCHISGDVAQIPCRVERKKAPVRKQRKNPLVTGITLEPIGDGDYYGFEIDGDKLFMLGDFTVTHNTPVIGRICNDHDGHGIVTAHRGVLVTQISQQLAREGIKHSIIGSEATKRQARNNHIEELGRNFVDPHSAWNVASVDTLVGMNPLDDLFRRTTKFIGDEAHHFLKMNKWGRAWHLCRNPGLQTLLLTATPARADGMGLGIDNDGVADLLIDGPDMRWGVDNGYLTGYRIWCPKPTDLDLSGVDITETGDYNQVQLRKAMAKSTAIVGDIVSTYCKHAKGMLGVTFAVDVSEATKIAAAFNAAGVPAVVLSSKTPEAERNKQLKLYAARQILQLVNVDLFGEGFDLPAIECLSMGRPTASWPLFMQQFNRATRLMISRLLMNAWDTFTVAQRKQHIAESPKPFAYIFDHVGNVLRHGLPDKPRVFNLDRRAKRGGPSDAIPTIACPECENPYEIIEPRCPWCGAEKPLPDEKERSAPNLVGGDIFELTDEQRRKMLGDAEGVMSSFVAVRQHLPPHVGLKLQNDAHARRSTQRLLRHYTAWWAGLYPGEPNSKIVQRFFYTFQIDMLSAFSLKTADATALIEKIKEKLDGIVINDLDSIRQP